MLEKQPRGMDRLFGVRKGPAGHIVPIGFCTVQRAVTHYPKIAVTWHPAHKIGKPEPPGKQQPEPPVR